MPDVMNGDTADLKAVLRKHPRLVPLSYHEHGDCLWDVRGGDSISCCPDMRWDGVIFAGLWIPDAVALDNIWSAAYASALPGVEVTYMSKRNPDGTCITRKPREGEKPYFTDGTCIDARFNNIITYTLPDGRTRGGYKTFANAYRYAARALGIKPADPEFKTRLESAFQRELRKYAASVCDTYTKWCNGECFGYIVKPLDADGEPLDDHDLEDSCWGFIGYDYAWSSAKEAADHVSEQLEITERETALAEAMP